MNHEKYFTPDGFCYLIRWYNSETEKQQQVFLFNRNNNKVLMFKNNAEFHTHWLNEIAAAENEKPIFICDGPGSTGKVRAMKKNWLIEFIWCTSIILNLRLLTEVK